MTDSVTSNVPYSYYNVLNPSAPAPKLAPTTTTNAASATTASSTASTSPTSGVQLSSTVLSLLQQFLSPNDSSSSSDPLSTLLGSSSNSSGLNSLLSSPTGSLSGNVYTSLLTAAYGGATQKAEQAAHATDPLQNVLSSYQAYQSASSTSVTSKDVQAVIAANSYLPDGSQLPLSA